MIDPMAEQPGDQSAAFVDAVARFDSLSSLLSDLAQQSGRMSPGAIEQAVTLAQSDLDSLYRANVYAGRIVDAMPDECTRKGWDVEVAAEADGDPHPFADALRALGLRQAVNRADKLARKDGGSAVYLGIEDGREQREPVDKARIRRVTHLTVIEAWCLQPHSWQTDFRAPAFGEPLTYLLTPYAPGGGATESTIEIHRDRLLLFGGRWVPARLAAENGHWPDSMLQRAWRIVMDFRRAEADIGQILRSFSQYTFKMAGLAKLVSGGNNAAVLARASLMNAGLGLTGMHLLDADHNEAVEFVTRSVAGVAELYDRLAQGVAAAAEMPLTMLFGQAPGGLTTDDAGGRTYWYDRVASRQRNDLQPHIERVVTLVGVSREGPTGGKLPERWDVVFRPLQELSDTERAALQKTRTETAGILTQWEALDAQDLQAAVRDAEGLLTDIAPVSDEDRAAADGVEMDAKVVADYLADLQRIQADIAAAQQRAEAAAGKSTP